MNKIHFWLIIIFFIQPKLQKVLAEFQIQYTTTPAESKVKLEALF
jgi:hypothetical protein